MTEEQRALVANILGGKTATTIVSEPTPEEAKKLRKEKLKKGVTCRIKIKEGTAPVYGKLRKMHPKVRPFFKDYLKKGLEEGMIEPAPEGTEWAANVVMAKKPADPAPPGQQSKPAWRTCIDYGAMNTHTVKDRFPLPKIDECIEDLEGRKYFSVIDLKSGFHQIPRPRRQGPDRLHLQRGTVSIHVHADGDL